MKFRLLIVAEPAKLDDARTLGAALAAIWEGPFSHSVVAADVVQDDALRTSPVSLVLGDDATHHRLRRLYRELESLPGAVAVMNERGVPLRLPHPDALSIPADLSVERLAGVLAALGHSQRPLRRLRNELAVARRCHGGLTGEITRIHEELQLAAMVQREFLPRPLPDLHGVHFAALWRPAHYVSGDIYDVARLDQDHLGVFIADAVGHGVPAALMTMIIRRSLTMKIIDGDNYQILEPAEVMTRLNRDLLLRQGTGTRFATAAYAVVNCRDRTVRLAGAGHPHPMLIGADDSVRELETDGPLLGVFESESFNQIELDLALGERLLFYSDGFEQAFPSEADDRGRGAASMQYRDEFARLFAISDPDDMVNALRRRVDDARGSLHQADDMTFLCMRAGPLAAEGAEDAPLRAEAA